MCVSPKSGLWLHSGGNNITTNNVVLKFEGQNKSEIVLPLQKL